MCSFDGRALAIDIHRFAARQIGVYLRLEASKTHTHTKSIYHFRHNNIININLKILKSTFGKVGGRGTLK